MKLYLDDNLSQRALAGMLASAGHDVVRSLDVGMSGAADPQHLAWAVRDNRVAMTCDHDDYFDLHELILATGGTHPGILVIRFDNDPTRDMKPREIVGAIRKLEQPGMNLTNQFIILNHWR